MKKYISIIAVFFTVGISGCKKDFLSLEVNPNSPSVTTPQLSLAGAENDAAAIINTNYSQDGIWVGYWTPSGNYVPDAAVQQFQITNTSYTAVWTALYQNLTNLNNLQILAAKDPALGNFQAIAMILKAYDFQQLVDQFNDVPYSKAFQPSTILFPSYDKAQDIYNDLVKQLDAAIGIINKSTGGTNPGTSDITFGGNMTGWKKMANSIKLRLAIRQSTKLATNTAASDLASTAGEGYLDESTQAVANPGYANVAGKQSPFWLNYGSDANGNATFPNAFYRGNKFFINLLSTTNDPRTNAVYAITTGTNKIDGNVFGDTKTTLSNPATSAIGPGLLISPSQGAVLFSGAESLFLQAEAVLDGYITTGTAQDYYKRGITASFVALGLTAAQAATYYGQAVNNVGYTSSANPKAAIVYQKYVSLVGYNNLEAYLENQRTGIPVLKNPVSIDPSTVSNIIPVRQYYPLSELTTNADNLAKEGTINIFTSKIFWEN